MSVLWTAGAKKISTANYSPTITQTGRTETTFTVQKTDYFTGQSEASWLPSDIESEYAVFVYQNHFFPGFPYYYYSQTPVRTASVTRGENVGEYTASYEYLPGGSYKFFAGVLGNSYPPLT